MPDAPEKPLDPNAILREKEARKKSPPYRRVHPTVTVWDFVRLKGDYKAQRRVDRECEEIEGGFRQWIAKQGDNPAHWLVKVEGHWQQEIPV